MPLRPLLTTAWLLGVSVAVVAASLVLLSPPAGAQGTAVTIEKATNGVDADTGSGPIVSPGESLNFTYQVTITGSTTLYDLIVTDSSGINPNCDIDGDGSGDGTHIHPGPLGPGQSFRCTATGTAPAGSNSAISSVASVRAFDFDGIGGYDDDDPSNYTTLAPFNATPGVIITSLVNGLDSTDPSGPYVGQGSEVTVTYLVSNAGNVPLTSIIVGNGSGWPVDCGNGSPVVAGPVAPGGAVTCTSTGTAPASSAGLQETWTSVEAQPVDPTTGAALASVDDDDTVAFTPVQLPERLAFTGPTEWLTALGAALAAAGAALWALGGLTARHRRANGVAPPR